MESEKENTKYTVIMTWEDGAKRAYPAVQRLARAGKPLKIAMGFADAERVELEGEYAALCDRLYVFTPNGSCGAMAGALQAMRDILDEGENAIVYCPDDMKNRLRESFPGSIFA